MNKNNVAELMVIRRVYEAGSRGDCVEVGEDGDGLELLEVRFRDDTQNVTNAVSFSPDAAPLVAAAILECAKELKAKEGK